MKILIIRRDNIGDLVCTTPLFAAIRQKLPAAYIAALVNSYNAPAVAGNPHLDDVFTYTKGKHADGESLLDVYWRKAKMLLELRRKKFDYVILAQTGFAQRSLRLARLIAPRHVIGFVSSETESKHIDHPIAQGDISTLHETEDMFRLLAPLGIHGDIPGLSLIPDPLLVQQLRNELPPAIAQLSGPLIALHISARKEKQRWPCERFSDLAHRLHQTYNARFLLFWSPGDENNPFHPGDNGKARRLLELMQQLPVAPIETLHLSQLIAGLSLADMAVLSDGGAMHLVAGLGKPMVCFFGNSSATRWHPWATPHELLQTPSRDVSDIDVDTAYRACTKVLG